MDQILAHRVRRSLIPTLRGRSLLGSQNLNETTREMVKLIGRRDMPMQRRRIELGQQIHPPQPGIDAIRNRNIHQSILARQRYRRLGSLVRQGVKPRARAAPHDDTQNVLVVYVGAFGLGHRHSFLAIWFAPFIDPASPPDKRHSDKQQRRSESAHQGSRSEIHRGGRFLLSRSAIRLRFIRIPTGFRPKARGCRNPGNGTQHPPSTPKVLRLHSRSLTICRVGIGAIFHKISAFIHGFHGGVSLLEWLSWSTRAFCTNE